jgi:hypothetical protein
VMGADRLLVVTWEHHGELLDTAFRADQHAVHLPYLHSILGLLGSAAPESTPGLLGSAAPESTPAPAEAPASGGEA